MPHRHGYKPLSVQALALAPSLPKVQRSAQPHDPALSLFTDLHHSPCRQGCDRRRTEGALGATGSSRMPFQQAGRPGFQVRTGMPRAAITALASATVYSP